MVANVVIEAVCQQVTYNNNGGMMPGLNASNVVHVTVGFTPTTVSGLVGNTSADFFSLSFRGVEGTVDFFPNETYLISVTPKV